MAHPERIMYVELKTGYSDNGPAWIGRVRFSKTGRTANYRGLNLRRHNGISGNYIDVKTGEEYWISGVKRDVALVPHSQSNAAPQASRRDARRAS